MKSIDIVPDYKTVHNGTERKLPHEPSCEDYGLSLRNWVMISCKNCFLNVQYFHAIRFNLI